MQFKIFYEDGSTYSGDPFLSPVFKVLVIVEADKEHGKKLVSGGDYYVWTSGHWYAVDYPGMIQYLADPGPRRVLLGVMTDGDTWNKAMKEARNDPDFPTQTAYHVYENKAG